MRDPADRWSSIVVNVLSFEGGIEPSNAQIAKKMIRANKFEGWLEERQATKLVERQAKHVCLGRSFQWSVSVG